MTKREYLYIIILISILTILSFWQVIFFHFWRDDWGFLWTALHSPSDLVGLTVHPATWLEDVVLIKLFGWNPYFWNLFGLILRVLASLSFGAMMWSFMRQKTVAILSSLFLACSYIGLESVGWLSAHVVPITIILICLGFYFWFNKDKNYLLNIFLAIFFFTVAFVGDPGRTFPVILLILIWEVFQLMLTKDVKHFAQKLISILVINNAFLLLYILLMTHFGSKANQALNILSLSADLDTFKYFLSSIGNLLLGSFIKTEEFGSTSGYNSVLAVVTVVVVFLAVTLSSIFGFFKRSEKILTIAWFTFWILMFYFPNWLFNPTYVASGTHRYFGIAGIGFIAVIALLIANVGNKKIVVFLSSIWILANIATSNRVLQQESTHRSIENVDRVWDKVIADVSKTKQGEIFIFTGDYHLKQSIVEWSGRIWPYVVKTGVKKYPQVVLDNQEALEILCSRDTYGLDNIHSWQIEGDTIVNTSQQTREYLKDIALKRNCHIK